MNEFLLIGEFDDVLDGTHEMYPSESERNVKLSFLCNSAENLIRQLSNGHAPAVEHQKLLEIQNLTLETPRSRRILISDLSLEIDCMDHLLIMGPSGSGKTSLLRALAGLWNTGNGTITYYLEEAEKIQTSISADLPSFKANNKRSRAKGIFFLPQRPYMVLGTLRDQLLYPTWSENLNTSTDGEQSRDSWHFLAQSSDAAGDLPKKPTTDDLIHVLETVRLGNIVSRFNGLDTSCEWSSVLSLGEQQRLAFARLLLSQPTLVLLDESTSALDEANETHLYKLIENAGITYISIGHRRTLYNYHSKVLHISNFSGESGSINWSLKSIDGASIELGK